MHIKKSSQFYNIYKILTTFILVSFAWIFFRADSLNDAFRIIEKIFISAGPVFFENISNLIFAFTGIGLLIIIDLKREYFNDRWSILYNKHSFVRITGIVLLLLLVLLTGVFDGGQFIYFQF